MTETATVSSIRYRERLWLGWRGIGLSLLFLLGVAVSVGAVNLTAGIVTTIGTAFAMGVALVLYAAPVQVAEGTLTAGRAHIPVKLTGTVTVLGADDVRAQIGPGSDARTYAVLRSSIRKGVLVSITDPEDPTPAWLISSRRPEQLRAAIESAQSAHSVQTGRPSRISAN